MNRQLTLLFAAFEALIVVAIGVAIPLVPLTLMWGIQYGLAIDWTVFWRAAVDVWLLGHGTDMTLVLDLAIVGSLGLPEAGAPVTITVALLGFALLTLLLGVRAGRRVAETPYVLSGALASLTTFGVASFAVALSARHPAANPSLWQGTLLPTLVFALGLLIGSQIVVKSNPVTGGIRQWIFGWPDHVRTIIATALRGGAIVAAGLLAVASLVAACAIVTSFAEMITLYEALHGEVLGGVAITIGQFAVLPNVVIWAAAWLIGPGFAIGAGSAVTPLATTLGPIPAIPLFGALPNGNLSFGFIGLIVPLVLAFVVAALLGSRVAEQLRRRELAILAVGIGFVAASIIGVLAWAAAGSAGPGRLVSVGSEPWSVAAWAFLEFTLAAGLGLVATTRVQHEEEQDTDEVFGS